MTPPGCSETLLGTAGEGPLRRARQLPDDDLSDSDLILPAADATLAEVRELLRGSDEGLVPN